MIVKYYKDDDLKYAGRKRFKDISSYDYIKEEEQKSLLINDGATCTVKTSNSNICDYVTIEDDNNNITRWFVTSYVYLNGGQVELYLQRDVIGEFGIKDIYAKIERGYTDTVLRNRKELNLNEVLKDRKMLIPDTNTYGNFSVDNHTNELWGFLYFNIPNEDVPVPIPGYSPRIMNYPLIDDGTKTLNSSTLNIRTGFHIGVKIGTAETIGFYCILREIEVGSNLYNDIKIEDAPSNPLRIFEVQKNSNYNNMGYTSDYQGARNFIAMMCNVAINQVFKTMPPQNTYTELDYDYNNIVVKDENTFYKYIKEIKTEKTYGETENPSTIFENQIGQSYVGFDITNYDDVMPSQITITNERVYNINKYNRSVLTPEEAGTVVISSNIQLVDEPYTILAFPLFDTVITDTINETSFNINREKAFSIFNEVINHLSGENGYLIDAQVYPYCPKLVGVSTSLKEPDSEEERYPIFSILSNSYNHEVFIDLDANNDVKKEYIQRKYIISSPEQSGTFEFNFYDYKVSNTDLKIIIKTALKPFAIISSAVIIPDNDSLKGMTFDDDMRGCNPSANGFQCSLSSNAFETYKRQNANYQQIFALQQEELSLQHATELVNEQTSRTVNTLSASAMGAIGGAAAGQAIGGRVGAAIGAGIAGAAAGITTNIAMNKQIEQNEKLREFERDLQSQMFNLNIGTIKALPNSVNRISSFNEILLNNFWYCIEVYECTEEEKELVDDFIEKYGYGLGVYGYLDKYHMDNWFLRGTIVTSLFPVNLANIASNELKGGIYYNE